MDITINMNKSTKSILIYGVVLYFIWAILELIIVPMINMDLFIVKTIVLKNLIWTLPAIYLIKRYNKDMFVQSKEMYSFKINWILILGLIIIMLIVQLLLDYLTNGKIEMNSSFNVIDIIDSGIIAGLAEELVFRGCFLNKMINKKNKWLMILVNAALFLIVHFPIWIREGVFAQNIMSGGFITIMILSIAFSWVFIKCKSIWGPIVLHMMWNIFCCMFV